ncbi:MAG: GPW/gp25 family protein [Candidatus Peribacteraceae bacterium]|nr:GPW/gp25 family protein [Candidatus Peribacteraceae bacterium]
MSTYKDFDLNFLTHPVTGDLSMKTDVRDVMQSMRTLVLTGEMERPFKPEMNGGVYALLFDLNSPGNILLIRRHIENVLDQYEPRADVHSVEVRPVESFTGVVIRVKFSLKNFNEIYSLDVALNQLR